MIKKITALFLACMTFVFSLSACGNKDAAVPDGMKRVENEKNTYALFVPEDWTIDMTDGEGTAKAYASDNSNISLVIMDWDGSYTSVQEYCDSYYNTLTSTFKDVSEREMYSDNQYLGTIGESGEPVLKYIYSIVSDNPATEDVETYKFMQIFAYHGGNMYIFTYTALCTENNDLFAKHIDEVYDIVDNFIA